MKKIILINWMFMLIAACLFHAEKAEAWKCDRHPEKSDCTTNTTWDDRYYEGPYCDGPPPEDYEEPRCEGRNTPTTVAPPTSSTTVTSTTTTTIVPTTAPPHQDTPPPIINIDKPEVLNRVIASDPVPLTELPKTGGEISLLLAGISLALGGAGVMLGKKR